MNKSRENTYDDVFQIEQTSVDRNRRNELTAVQPRMKNRILYCCIGIIFVVSILALTVATVSTTLASRTGSTQTQATLPSCPGSSSNQAAVSCQQALNCNASSPSGMYWISTIDGDDMLSYCNMNRACGGFDGGWMRVAMLDMRDRSSRCPQGLTQREDRGQILCGRGIDIGCSQVFFKNHVPYDQVCGKIIAYQSGSTDSFGLRVERTIDDTYIEGVSLTYSSNPRKHIWSFAAALDEVGTFSRYNCPCTNIDMSSSATPPPDFVGNDYFCDTGSKETFINNVLYREDPLWDGAGCGPLNFCCSLNNPPWFFKQLKSSTTSDIEMRVCANQEILDEDVRIKQIEIYVR